MESNDYKTKLRAAVSKAYRHHRRNEVAEAVGCSNQTISNFMSGGPLGPQFRARLEMWLVDRGFLEIEGPPEASTAAASVLAADLRVVANVLDSPDFSDEFKRMRFESAVNSWNAALQESIGGGKKGKGGG